MIIKNKSQFLGKLFDFQLHQIVISFWLTILFISPLWAQQKSNAGIRHSIVISGPKTFEFSEKDKVIWKYDDESKDISKLMNGNYLITYANKVIEVTPTKKIVWTYMSLPDWEFMSAQRLTNGMTLVTELGEKPRLVEVDSKGKVSSVIPVLPETDNVHMQSRMGRKLVNGNYLVPHRIMPFVKEYDKEGNVLQTFRLDLPELGGSKAENGSFAAVRLKDGSTVITCASGNRMVIFDKQGKLVWHLTTEELGGVLKDVCGLQVLENGNFVVSCFGNQSEYGLKMLEITRDKKIVWTYQNTTVRYVHNLHVLSTNGKLE